MIIYKYINVFFFFFLHILLKYIKSNFAILDKETGIVTSRRADRNFEKPGPILCDALNGLYVK